MECCKPIEFLELIVINHDITILTTKNTDKVRDGAGCKHTLRPLFTKGGPFQTSIINDLTLLDIKTNNTRAHNSQHYPYVERLARKLPIPFFNF